MRRTNERSSRAGTACMSPVRKTAPLTIPCEWAAVRSTMLACAEPAAAAMANAPRSTLTGDIGSLLSSKGLSVRIRVVLSGCNLTLRAGCSSEMEITGWGKTTRGKNRGNAEYERAHAILRSRGGGPAVRGRSERAPSADPHEDKPRQERESGKRGRWQRNEDGPLLEAGLR